VRSLTPLGHESASLTPASRATFWRTLQTFNLTRVAIGLVLLAYLGINSRKGFWSPDGFIYLETCVVYLALAVVFTIVAARWRHHFLSQMTLQLVVDVIIITLLYTEAGGSKSGLAILYLFPLAGSAILAPMLLALFFVSLVTLVLLLESAWRLLESTSESTISVSGLYGAAFFAAVYMINRLAGRLIRQEQLTASHGQDLRIQQSINRLVIAAMGDGVLVVGNDGTILTANPAAERLLGMGMLAPADETLRLRLTDVALLNPIGEAFFGWWTRRSDAPVFVVIKPGDDAGSVGASVGPAANAPVAPAQRSARRELILHLKLRFASVVSAETADSRTVIFLQDVGEIENQAQQLKLASMGRLTASIAHEVRNPLSAISYAAGLLGEELRDPGEIRLVAIVHENVARLNRMIEDILKLSRKARTQDGPILLERFCKDIVDELVDTVPVAPGVIRLDGFRDRRVAFDPLHLREVVVNLLSNALRYASGRPGSIRLFAVMDMPGRLELHVRDDGEPITPEVRAHLFEPFYTTSSKGTGLGLYLARELCLNNNAMLDYEYRNDPFAGDHDEPGGRFVISFALA
jgi:two-component system sensor histidine kinase PilS (NtrC family)